MESIFKKRYFRGYASIFREYHIQTSYKLCYLISDNVKRKFIIHKNIEQNLSETDNVGTTKIFV